jgi:hypothetical protein
VLLLVYQVAQQRVIGLSIVKLVQMTLHVMDIVTQALTIMILNMLNVCGMKKFYIHQLQDQYMECFMEILLRQSQG